jgi:hypothetical protein
MWRLFFVLSLFWPALCVGAVTPVMHQVTNAPIWRPAHSYTHIGHFGDRVLVSTGAPTGYQTLVYGGDPTNADVIDGGGAHWKFGAATGTDWIILVDDNPPPGGGAGRLMGKVGSTIWVQNSVGAWFYWSGSGWTQAYLPPWNTTTSVTTPPSLAYWTDGAPVYLLELTSAGSSNATAMPIPTSCPSTGITDGEATWQCLTQVDYVDLTNATNDDIAWQPGGHYLFNQLVAANNQVWYMCAGPWLNGDTQLCPGSSWPRGPNFTCTAASSGTGPTVPKGPNLDGTCAWIKVGDVPYSSNHANAYQHAATSGDPSGSSWGSQPLARANHIFNLWGGGGVVPAYNKSLVQNHLGLYTPNPSAGGGEYNIFCPGNGDMHEQGVNGCWTPTFQAAHNDSLCNWPAGTPLRYDALPAVRFDQANDGALQIIDSIGFLKCLQVRSTGARYPAIYGIPNSVNAPSQLQLKDSIVDCDYASCIISDNATVFANVLCINRYTGNGATCVETKYAHSIFNSTFVGLGNSTGSVAFANHCLSQHISFETNGAPSLYNNIFVGFAQQIGWNNCYGAQFNYNAGQTFNNATDLPGTQAAGSWSNAWTNQGTGTSIFGGTATQYNQSPSAIFVSRTNDFRLKSGSFGIGAGRTYTLGVAGTYGYATVSPDMFGKTRPASGGRYDLGAAQFNGAARPPTPSGGAANWRRRF